MTQTSENVLQAPSFWLSTAWQGAFWKIASCACFAGINGVVRYLSGGGGALTLEALPVNVLMFFQNVFGTLFLLPWILKMGFGNLTTRHPGLHFIRVVTAVAGVYLFYLTLKVMPIAEGVALTFTGPILTVIGASFFLQEKIDAGRLLAILLSLTGAFVISRPDLAFSGNEAHPVGLAALLPLSSALALTFNKLLTRKLAGLGESPIALATYLLLLMAPVSLLPAVYEWVTPSLNHWPWLIMLGALAAAAHLSFAKAYKLAEVTFLTPFGFSKFFLSALVGYLAFAELPVSRSLWIGVTIIFMSILLLAYKMSLYSIATRLRSN